MSARVESLFAQLQTIKDSIVERSALGQPIDDLVLAEKKIVEQLSRARQLLTENAAATILRG